jgi:hypothetical protein
MATLNVLSAVQDYISIALRQPWPRHSGLGEIPLPNVILEDSQLQMWYGDRESPAVAFSPIDVRQLLAPNR